MIKFNICFIKLGNNILLLNRENPTWMGCWNGIGGKLEVGETPRQSMFREIHEETDIPASEYQLAYKGIVTWKVDEDNFGGMYLYLAELSKDFNYVTPIKTVEGILDWKSIDWILHPKNLGISSNIPIFLEYILNDKRFYEHHCTYREGKLTAHLSEEIHASTEDAEEINKYLMNKYFEEIQN